MRSSQEHQPSHAGRLQRRRTDRIEDAVAWLLSAAGLFLVLLGGSVGTGVHRGVVELARADEHELVQIDAVLLEGAGPEYVPGSPAAGSVRYVDTRGRPHDAVVNVAGGTPAGTSVPIWVDQEGRPAVAPPTAFDAVVLGAFAVVGTVALGGLVLAGTWLGVRRWLTVRNSAAWAREWALVEPEWSGRTR